MIEIPDDVEQWTSGKIVDLVNEGYDENDILEIKREINQDSERLIKTTCAFANTNGGTIIFGIDNDRNKPLHLDQRIIGISDSDQLKRNIIDKIKNIQPSIPIKNLIFRKTNLKIPHKKEVIVILKVSSSDSKPHQYKHTFYKRLSDGNEPMDVSEVKHLILESQKQSHHIILLALEFDLIYNALEEFKTSLNSNSTSFGHLKYIDITSTVYFQYNLAYLYPTEVPSMLASFIHNIKRLLDIPMNYKNALTGQQIALTVVNEAKKEKYEQPKEYVRDLILTRVNSSLKEMKTLAELLDFEISPVTRIKVEKS